MNGPTSVLANGQDPEKPVMPGYAIAILAIGLFIITAIVVFLLLRSYRRNRERNMRNEIKNNYLADVMRERQRLLS